jgi:hypothetical protein
LTPVNALYVKTTGWGQVGFKYSATSQPGVSSKELVEGWNLVSTASSGDATDILSPLRYATIGGQQAICLATLVSQSSYNLFTSGWYLDATTWENLEDKIMNPFDGYWIYLNGDKSFGVVLP